MLPRAFYLHSWPYFAAITSHLRKFSNPTWPGVAGTPRNGGYAEFRPGSLIPIPQTAFLYSFVTSTTTSSRFSVPRFYRLDSAAISGVFLKPAFEIGRDVIFWTDVPKNLCGTVGSRWNTKRPPFSTKRDTENHGFRVKRRTSR